MAVVAEERHGDDQSTNRKLIPAATIDPVRSSLLEAEVGPVAGVEMAGRNIRSDGRSRTSLGSGHHLAEPELSSSLICHCEPAPMKIDDRS